MSVLIVGNVIKDIYLNLDNRKENLEIDQNHTKWLDLSFNAASHSYFNRSSNFGGAAVTFECLNKLGLVATINGSDLSISQDGLITNQPVHDYRYILLADEAPCYFVPTNLTTTQFSIPTEPYDYLYIDRSAHLDQSTINKILAYLQVSPNTKLIIYLRDVKDPTLTTLFSHANLIFLESSNNVDNSKANIPGIESSIIVHLKDNLIQYQNVLETIDISRPDLFTHLSIYSIISATILGCFVLGKSVEQSLHLAKLNAEQSKLNSALSLDTLETLNMNTPKEDLTLIARSLVLRPKGILAADESGGSIHKKFAALGIPDTYDTRRDYRNIFFTTPNLADYVNGVILFDETARQTADNGQNFVEYLINKRIIPGIKVDQGLAPLAPNSIEQVTRGLDNLPTRLAEYYQMGLRFAKWRAAFNIHLNYRNEVLTPTTTAITKNCEVLAKYAKFCQNAKLVPIVEPEVVYDGFYDIDTAARISAQILDTLFEALNKAKVDLKSCILKTNMVLAGKHFTNPSTPDLVGARTAEVLRNHVPAELAGIVFLSGGQTVEQATNNLAAIIKNGPFPWPVTFSFARALQDPALYAWSGDNANIEIAHQAFLDRLIANTNALK